MNIYILVFYALVILIVRVIKIINWRGITRKLFNSGLQITNNLFANNFIDVQVLFAKEFREAANISFIKNIDTSLAYALVLEKFENEITATYQFDSFDFAEGRALFNLTIFVLRNQRIIELGYDYAKILYTPGNYKWASSLLGDLATFRLAERTKVIGFANSEVLN